jgi:ribulose-bisphosphate carboxylase small chain
MKLTQGQFAFLPKLTDAELVKQIDYALSNGWAVSIEHTKDPHPRNTYWAMYGNPMFDLKDAAGIMMELNACRRENEDSYIRLLAFDSTKGWESIRMNIMTDYPVHEPGFELIRSEGIGRRINYTMRSYTTSHPMT